jgi:hypothetical protein
MRRGILKKNAEKIASEKKDFTTLDSYLAGYLSLRGFAATLVSQGDKVVFIFEATDDLYRTLEDYNTGATIEALRFALTVKTLKSQIYSIRRNHEKEKGEPKWMS